MRNVLEIEPIESDKRIEPAEPEVLERKKSAETTLAALRKKDSELRGALDMEIKFF